MGHITLPGHLPEMPLVQGGLAGGGAGAGAGAEGAAGGSELCSSSGMNALLRQQDIRPTTTITAAMRYHSCFPSIFRC